MNTIIYALCDPLTEEVRYIGKTKRKAHTRLRNHITEAKRRIKLTHKANWVYSLLCKNLEPTMSVLEVVADGENWEEREKWWIVFAREQGFDLTNLTDGGEGTQLFGEANGFYGRKHSEESLRKIREALKDREPSFKGKHHTEEAKQKNREAHLGVCSLSPEQIKEYRKRFSGEGNPFYGMFHSEETKQQISENRKGKGIGSNNGSAKLTDRDVLEIRCLYSTGKFKQTVLAKMFFVGQQTISRIVNYVTWAHL